jgi:hypothetical protein
VEMGLKKEQNKARNKEDITMKLNQQTKKKTTHHN